MTFEELKEKYKDGWWEGHDGYTGDDMFNDIEWLIKHINKSEKERWKTAMNLFECRKKLKEIKQVVNPKGGCENETNR